jgi:hypothetical protein
MANEIKYNDQVWGAPIAGERLSTNGYYTGEHKGTPMQDAKTSGTDLPHGNENLTVHLGTITQDALADAMPTVKVEDGE